MNNSVELSYALEKNISFWDFKGHLDTVDSWPLMSSPFPMLTIIASYLLYVLKIGPEYMKSRQPYSLKNVIVLYNVLQVCSSLYIVYLACQLTWPHGWVGKTCLLERKDTRDKLTTVLYYYFLAKVSEVLDTVFFILRKKHNQVTFLHVYHHSLMIITSWFFLKYEPIYPSLFLRNINSFVHVVMYSYYALSSFPSLTKYLWWKKYITGLQLVQFSLLIIHFALSYATSECTPSFTLCLLIFGNASLFIYLFGKFYLENYKKEGSKGDKISSMKDDDKTANRIFSVNSFNDKANDVNNVDKVINRKKLMMGN